MCESLPHEEAKACLRYASYLFILLEEPIEPL